MRAFRRHLRACTWLALAAIAALALGPTISRLRLPDAGNGIPAFAAAVAVVDHASMRHAAIDHGAMQGGAMEPTMATAHRHLPLAQRGGGDAPTPPLHQHALEHCGLCVLAASAFAVAPAPPRVEPVACLASCVDVRPEPRTASAHSTWSPAQPRGPPFAA